MSRERMTRVGAEGRTLLAEIDRLERFIGAEDEEKVVKEEGQSEEELLEVAEDIGDDDDDELDAPAEAGMDQNERAMKNWPMKASEKHAVAKRLVALAKALIG